MLLVETDIETKIRTSSELNDNEKDQFTHLLSYFTPTELEELRGLL